MKTIDWYVDKILRTLRLRKKQLFIILLRERGQIEEMLSKLKNLNLIY